MKGQQEDFKAVLGNIILIVLFLGETKLDESYSNSEFLDLDKWNEFLRKDRNIFVGGIIMAVLRKYVATPIEINYDNGDNPESYGINLLTILIEDQ